MSDELIHELTEAVHQSPKDVESRRVLADLLEQAGSNTCEYHRWAAWFVETHTLWLDVTEELISVFWKAGQPDPYTRVAGLMPAAGPKTRH